jgi:hypothetical protein
MKVTNLRWAALLSLIVLAIHCQSASAAGECEGEQLEILNVAIVLLVRVRVRMFGLQTADPKEET